MPHEEPRFEIMLKTLASHEVDFVVVGELCAAIHSVPGQTINIEIVPARDPENLERLERALYELGAYYREHSNKRLVPEAARMATAGHHLLNTSAGPIDVLGTIAGGRDYANLLPHTLEIALDDTRWIRILDLATLILTKQETGREKDLLMLPILRRTLEEIERASNDSD